MFTICSAPSSSRVPTSNAQHKLTDRSIAYGCPSKLMGAPLLSQVPTMYVRMLEAYRRMSPDEQTSARASVSRLRLMVRKTLKPLKPLKPLKS
jgi:hypothetical protein